MKVKSWKVELVYWVITIFELIGGMMLARYNNGSMLVWGIGTVVCLIGVSMMFIYLKVMTETDLFDSDELEITEKEDYYE